MGCDELAVSVIAQKPLLDAKADDGESGLAQE
jgi:hypothetical protein